MKASMDSLTFSIFLFIVYFIIFTLDAVHCSPTDVTGTKRSPIVYRRYVRRRPPTEPDGHYIEEYMEVFYTQRKPPTIINPLSDDDDIDKFLSCDFNSETEDCTQYWSAKNPLNFKEIIDRTAASSKSVKPTASPVALPVTTSEMMHFGSKLEPSTRRHTTTASRIRPTTLEPTAEIPYTKTIINGPPPLTNEDTYRIPDIPLEDNYIAESEEYDGLNGDEDDEEDLYDQNPNTTTPKNLFKIWGW